MVWLLSVCVVCCVRVACAFGVGVGLLLMMADKVDYKEPLNKYKDGVPVFFSVILTATVWASFGWT